MEFEYAQYIKPELLVLVAALYMIGNMLKRTPSVKNWKIPYILTVISLILTGVYVVATTDFFNYRDMLMGLFVSIVQGIACAGLAVYTDQMRKQIINKS